MADSCNKKFGVKNLMIGFRPCNGEPNIAPIAHELYEDVPQWRLVNHTAESLPEIGRASCRERVSSPV